MKSLLLLLVAVGACHPDPTARRAVLPAAHEAKANLPAKVQPDTLELPSVPVRYRMVLRTDIESKIVRSGAEIQRFYATHDLAPLLQTVTGSDGDRSMQGFRGPDRYRTEVVITSARRNPQNPLAYAVQGLTRTKRRIKAFQGEIVFDYLSVEPMLTARDNDDIKTWTMVQIIRFGNDKTIARYAVAGSVQLAESKDAPDASAFQGRVVMELELTKKGRVHVDAPFLHGPSQGGGQKFAGTWTAYATGATTPAVFVDNIIGYGPFIHQDFLIGEREVEINPKYAKQGWNSYWENEEWWVGKSITQR